MMYPDGFFPPLSFIMLVIQEICKSEDLGPSELIFFSDNLLHFIISFFWEFLSVGEDIGNPRSILDVSMSSISLCFLFCFLRDYYLIIVFQS